MVAVASSQYFQPILDSVSHHFGIGRATSLPIPTLAFQLRTQPSFPQPLFFVLLLFHFSCYSPFFSQGCYLRSSASASILRSSAWAVNLCSSTSAAILRSSVLAATLRSSSWAANLYSSASAAILHSSAWAANLRSSASASLIRRHSSVISFFFCFFSKPNDSTCLFKSSNVSIFSSSVAISNY